MARSIWTGSVTFGLVSIPVKLLTAVRSHDIHFNMICQEEGTRVRRKLVCGDEDREVSQNDTARGYQIAPDEYVIVRREELDQLSPRKSREIEIERFVDIAEIDPIYFERPYYLVPSETGAKAYRLLLEVMRESGRAGIARFVMRNKEYLVALRPQEGALSLVTMRFHDEVVGMDEIRDALPDQSVEVDERQKKVALQLVESLSEAFHPEDFQDDYRQRVMALIEQKAEGKEVLTIAEDERTQGRVLDLMQALQESVEENKRRRAEERDRKRA